MTTIEVAEAKPIAAATHRDKIIAAIRALLAAGAIGPWSRDAEVKRKARAWLRAHGCSEADLPSDSTWKRVLPKLRVIWHTGRVGKAA
jgi:hypothetical protein